MSCRWCFVFTFQSTVNQTLVAPSICDNGVLLYLSNNLHFRSKHHKTSLVWLRRFFALFKFVWKRNCIIKPTTLNGATFTRNKLCNFPIIKFSMKFVTLFQSSRYDSQLYNGIGKFLSNFGNFKWISDTVCQNFVIHTVNASAIYVLITSLRSFLSWMLFSDWLHCSVIDSE